MNDPVRRLKRVFQRQDSLTLLAQYLAAGSTFWFVRSPEYSSFAVIEISGYGKLPQDIPPEILRLMPGNQTLALRGVVVEQDEKYLLHQVVPAFVRRIENLDTEPWIYAPGLTYRLVCNMTIV